MVTRRARSLFAVLFACVLLPIVTMVGAGAGEARAHAAMAWMQWTARSQSAVQQGADAGHGEIAAHHSAATPFAPVEPFALRLHGGIAASAAESPRVVVAGAS